MSRSQADVVIHPVRFRILQTLMAEDQSTKQIARHLSDVPASSLYRHLKILLEAGYIRVVKTRMVQGIQEKIYSLVRSPLLAPEDFQDATDSEHLRYFTIYLMTLLHGFADYLDASAEVDFIADNAGYTEVILWASSSELESFASSINKALAPMLNYEPGAERQKHKIAVVTYPVREMRKVDE